MNGSSRLWAQIECGICVSVARDDRSAVFNVTDYDQACYGGKVLLTGWVNHLSY